MASITINLNESIILDLADLVAHRAAVPPTHTVSEVYEFFQNVPHEFAVVTDEGR
jgi:hypothetical protein